jgi:hypothetical protein
VLTNSYFHTETIKNIPTITLDTRIIFGISETPVILNPGDPAATPPTTPTPDPDDPDPDPGGSTAEAKAEPIGVTISGSEQDELIYKSRGCPTGTYTSGILKGVKCDEPIKTADQVLTIVKNVVNQMFLPAASVLFIIMFTVGGIWYMGSNGNEERAKRAKKILTAAIVGLLITALAYAIITSFVYLLGGGIS